MISPMNSFNVTPNTAMYQIGRQSGPGGALNTALAGTLAKYEANMAAAREQQNKLALVGAQTAGQYNSALQLAKEKFAMTAPDPSIALQHDPNDVTKNTFNLGGVEMFYEPVKDAYGRVKGWRARNPRALSMMEMVMGGSGGGGQAESDEAEVDQLLKNYHALRGSAAEGI